MDYGSLTYQILKNLQVCLNLEGFFIAQNVALTRL